MKIINLNVFRNIKMYICVQLKSDDGIVLFGVCVCMYMCVCVLLNYHHHHHHHRDGDVCV